MDTKTIAASAGDQLVKVQRIGGSLKVEGWDRQEVEAEGDLVELGQEEDAITAGSGSDLSLKVPRGAQLQIGFVGRNLEMRELSGPVEISFVGADAALSNLSGEVTFRGMVGGRTRLENVSRVATGASGFGSLGGVGDLAWHKVEKAMGRAEEQRRRFEKKIRSAERKLERVRVGLESEGGRWTWRHGDFPFHGTEEASPATDEERTMILKMLQEKKITAEEADRLLQALEGKA